MDVTVVIPTKNAGNKIIEVISAVLSQKTDLKYEVICVDSGSTDGTVDAIKQFPQVCLLQISPEEFGHGKTRNYGASMGSGEFICFITQDAVPATPYWMNQLVNAVKNDPLCVGGFGIHYPYPDCNLIDKHDIESHFENLGDENTYYWIKDWKKYHTDEGYRLLMGYFSDNNSCVRRSFFEKHPYSDVNFAEDQIWARRIIELGYHKVYCPLAPVYHSHNYSNRNLIMRYFDEYKGMYEVYQYLLAPRIIDAIVGMVRKHKINNNYINSLKLPFLKRVYWKWCSIIKEVSRYLGGWLGGYYHRLSPPQKKWLDAHFSQQYKQRKI